MSDSLYNGWNNGLKIHFYDLFELLDTGENLKYLLK